MCGPLLLVIAFPVTDHSARTTPNHHKLNLINMGEKNTSISKRNSLKLVMSHLENNQMVEQTIEDVWTSPADHFRPRNKFLTLYTDRNYLVMKYTAWKSRFLGSAFVPTWTPLYFFMTHFEQRTRNLYLVENHLNYRPYKFRPNTETSKY